MKTSDKGPEWKSSKSSSGGLGYSGWDMYIERTKKRLPRQALKWTPVTGGGDAVDLE